MSKNDIDWLKVIIQAYGLSEALSLFSAACSALSCEIAKDHAHEALRLMAAACDLDGMSVEYDDNVHISA
jgi:hypothetical protein